ncbi:endoglucanase [Xylaria bambusicola]|uniref:endoglucanase n=1 Tax=Xylaria bambusicola TaxID=326684 RepID=UPI002007AF74|nr:endoglucanase [Xylaria bambusicola]KAI0506211.1 endoglucanase [Xylaria bambusicola]
MKLVLAASALASLASAQSLCDQYGYFASSGYYVNNNAWGKDAGSGSQCTYIDKVLSPGIQWHTDWNWSGGDNNVKSYPYSGRTLSSKKIVSSIGSMPTKAEWAYAGSNLRADVAYDIFTAADPNHDTSSGDYELMIWLAKKGNVQPIGSSTGTVNVAGRNWDLWVGYNGPMKVFSFVAPQEIAVFESDVKPFFNHIASAQGYPASSQYLTTFQFGTEPFTGNNAKFNVWYWYGEVN